VPLPATGADSAPLPSPPAPAPEPSLKDIARRASQAAEREAISKMLERTGWNRVRAARALRISYRALLYKIKQTGLEGERPSARRHDLASTPERRAGSGPHTDGAAGPAGQGPGRVYAVARSLGNPDGRSQLQGVRRRGSHPPSAVRTQELDHGAGCPGLGWWV